ncbi:hypothetical protein [Janthinobacterium lividum]|uniref:hypothetical protein n=1 Tax=Janthinobacterium lividum TaxID=29581 RepID=UPI0015956EF5|nr:hypothetical protein [Janthinobacterium lividum]QKY08810.1 hypothetical protein G8765_14315 [Janthinobacterium lividum]
MRAMRLGCAGLAQRFHAARGAPLWRFAHSGAPLQLRMAHGGGAGRHTTSVLHYWQQFRSAMGLVVRMQGMARKADMAERIEVRLLELRAKLMQAHARQQTLVRLVLPRLERGVAQAQQARAATIAWLARGAEQPALALAVRRFIAQPAAGQRDAAALARAVARCASLRAIAAAPSPAPARTAIRRAHPAAHRPASQPAAGGMARRAPARNGIAAPGAPFLRPASHPAQFPRATRPAVPARQAGAWRPPVQAVPAPLPAPAARAAIVLGRYQGRQPVRRDMRQAAPAATAELQSRVEHIVDTRMLGVERAVQTRVVHEIVHGGQTQEQLRKVLAETLFSAPVLASLTDRMASAIARRSATERYRRGGA